MSENLVIVSRVEDVKRQTNLKANELCGLVKTPSIVIGGDLAWVITLKTDRRQYLLIHTFPDELMNEYPVSSKIFSGQLTTNYLQPIGSRLKPVK